jgi:uncharacterized protein YeaO (DUF488 family)
MEIQTKRVYDPIAPTDGTRILVDRLWPRGLSKENAHVDIWLKDIAPSNELRKWFNHDPEKWKDFRSRYLIELRDKKELLQTIKDKASHTRVTLIYGAKDEQHNQAVVLLEHLNRA